MSHILSRRFLVAAMMVLLAALLFKLSYFQQNKEAYLFPSIVTGGILFFSLVSLLREAFDLCVDDFQPTPILLLIPGLSLIFAAVFLLEQLGMYAATFLVLLGISAWYSMEQNLARRLLKSLALAVGFSVCMYLLFSLMLGVQVPRGNIF